MSSLVFRFPISTCACLRSALCHYPTKTCRALRNISKAKVLCIYHLRALTQTEASLSTRMICDLEDPSLTVDRLESLGLKYIRNPSFLLLSLSEVQLVPRQIPSGINSPSTSLDCGVASRQSPSLHYRAGRKRDLLCSVEVP